MGWQDVHEPRWATFSVWSRAEGAQVLRTPRVCRWNSKLIGCYSACGARVQKLKKNTTESGHARQTDDGAGLCSIGLRGPSVPALPWSVLVCMYRL